MIGKILVPLDGSEFAEKALDYAIELAKKFSSNILLVHIVPTTTAMITGPEVLGTPLMLDLEKQMERSGQQILASGEAKTKKAGIEVATKLDYGSPADKIVKMVKDYNIDLVIIGDRGLGTVARFLLGSISDKVSHHAACPVLIVKT